MFQVSVVSFAKSVLRHIFYLQRLHRCLVPATLKKSGELSAPTSHGRERCKVNALAIRSVVMAGQKAPTGPREARPDDRLRAVFTSSVPAIHVFSVMHSPISGRADANTLR